MIKRVYKENGDLEEFEIDRKNIEAYLPMKEVFMTLKYLCNSVSNNFCPSQYFFKGCKKKLLKRIATKKEVQEMENSPHGLRFYLSIQSDKEFNTYLKFCIKQFYVYNLIKNSEKSRWMGGKRGNNYTFNGYSLTEKGKNVN